MLAWTVVLALSTIVLAVATVVLAVATADYAKLVRQPNVTGYFEASGNWINLIIQNSGTDVASSLVFAHDLSEVELDDIYGPNKHGKRYIVFETLEFLNHVTQLAPGQVIRHRWLYRWFALRDNRPRRFTLQATYVDRRNNCQTGNIHFDLAAFGTYDGTHVMEVPTDETI